MPQKKRPRRRRSPHEGSSRRRCGEDGASLSGSLVESDGSSSSSTTSGAPLSESLDQPSDTRSSSKYESRIPSPQVHGRTRRQRMRWRFSRI
ncbi:hypothetical protein VPH35_129497 [Triticum aestivum]